MKLLQSLLFFVCLTSSIQAQSFFDYPINVIDLDILEPSNTCFQGFNQEQLDMLNLIDVLNKRFELTQDFKLVGIIGEQGSEGIFVYKDSLFYPVVNSTMFNLSKREESRFLFMKHHRTGQFQLVQYQETVKHGYVIDVFNSQLRVGHFQNNLPSGTQRQFDIVTGKTMTQEAKVVPILNGNPAMFSDTFNTVDLGTYEESFYVTERKDSTSIIVKR